MPTDRHTATGTCEFGRAANRRVDPALQEKSTHAVKISCAVARAARGADIAEGRMTQQDGCVIVRLALPDSVSSPRMQSDDRVADHLRLRPLRSHARPTNRRC